MWIFEVVDKLEAENFNWFLVILDKFYEAMLCYLHYADICRIIQFLGNFGAFIDKTDQLKTTSVRLVNKSRNQVTISSNHNNQINIPQFRILVMMFDYLPRRITP